MDQTKVQTARDFIRKTYPDIPIPQTSYLVLSSARSGSTLLCSHLQKIGYGKPIEAFNPNTNPRKRLNWGIDYNDPHAFMKKAIEFQTVNEVMGMKLSPNQFTLFLSTARKLLETSGIVLTDAEILEVFFPGTRFIHLQRRKKVKQAISYAKALQNGVWRETTDQDDEYKKYLLPALYDREHIECCFDILMTNDVFWQQFMRDNHLSHMTVYYEDLAANYVDKMTEVYVYLGITGKEIIAPPLRKQANKESDEWETRFTAETPWLHDSRMAQAYAEGDLDTLYLQRSRMLMLAREQARWKSMPANRWKPIRSLLFKIKRKFTK